ncbi:MAG: hypothetical protein ABSC21_14100 [Terriglobia bacterium]|jgi:20S proteasome alpha/beta subunit
MNSVKPPTFQGHVDELELWPMTLIVALFNEQEIVFAADSMIFDSEIHAVPEPVHKLKVLGQFIFAASGTNVGYDIYDQLVARKVKFSDDIALAVHECCRETCEIYSGRRYNHQMNQKAFILLGGFGANGPAVYSWSLPFQGAPNSNPSGYAFIGTGKTAATAFPRLFHKSSLSTDSRIRMAHFCVTVAGMSDLRVGNPERDYPVDITVLTQNNIDEYSQERLIPFVKSSKKLYKRISTLFSNP